MKSETMKEVIPFYLDTWRMPYLKEETGEQISFATEVQTNSLAGTVTLVVKCLSDCVITYGTPKVKLDNSKALQMKLDKFNKEAKEGMTAYYDDTFHNVVLRKETNIAGGFPLTNEFLDDMIMSPSSALSKLLSTSLLGKWIVM